MDTMESKLDFGWDSTSVTDLAKLLSDSLHVSFHNAIKRIVKHGYNEETALSTVLRCGPFYGIKDIMSTIVDRCLDCLKIDRCRDGTWYKFEDLDSLVEYMMLEMVTMLIEIKPILSVREAIWTLLICDLNVLDASEANLDLQKFSIPGLKRVREVGSGSSAKPESEPETEKKIKEKCLCCKRWCSVHKRDPNRQKPSRFEKTYKGRKSKASLKAKLSNWGDLNKKSPTLPLQETKKKAKPETGPIPVPPEPPKTVEYYLSGIPFDETKSQHVPQDDKDRIILAAVGQLQSLQKEVKNWDDWANLKVMQVAKRLSYDRPELIRLKSEKQEAEKIMKDKQIMEESTIKKLTEITDTLNTTNCQIEMANLKIVRLEYENPVIKREKEVADNITLIEAKRLEERLCNEREALKLSESIVPEKNLLEENLRSLKREVGPTQRDLEKAKRLLKETETRLAKEERDTAKFLEQAERIRNERKRIESVAKSDEVTAGKKAEKELKKFETEIKRIEYEIAAMKLETETKKIAEMRKGMNFQLEASRNGPTGRKKDRECVMCLTEEMTVVFVPCGHQVLCPECNVIHEKNGMKECPSCRTPIQKRIIARFSKS